MENKLGLNNKTLRYLKILTKIRLSNLDQYYDKFERNLTKSIKPFWYKYLQKEFKATEAILIFSENRGGSTWIMETLQKQLEGISIFEPLFGWDGKFKKYNHQFSSPFYFGAKETAPLLKRFLEGTFEGRYTSSHTLQFNSLLQLYNGKKLLVKMVNVNLIAPWVIEEFNFKYKPIYLIRHPLAILASQRKYTSVHRENYSDKKLSGFDLSRLKSESHPYLKYLNIINSADTAYKRFLVGWCIRNKEFLKNSYSKKVIKVHYEDLVLNNKKVLKNIRKEWRMETPEDVEMDTSKASGTTAIGEQVLEGHRQLEKWFDFFSDEEKEDFQSIFDQFNITEYNAYDALPSNFMMVPKTNY